MGQHYAADFGVLQHLRALPAQQGPMLGGDVFTGQVAALHAGDAGHALDAGQGLKHEINSREEGTGWDNCKCGKPFKYYESLEECLFEKNKELITKFINSYESTVAMNPVPRYMMCFIPTAVETIPRRSGKCE